MPIWERFIYAVAFVAVVNAVVLLVLAIAAPDVMAAFVREGHWIVFLELAIAAAFAPALSRYIPRKRGKP